MNTKLHAIYDSQGHPLDLFVTAGQVSDYFCVDALNEAIQKFSPPEGERNALVDSHLEILNDNIWTASLHALHCVFATLLDPKGFARKTGIVSDHPMLTTDLVRSSALLNNATKLETLTVPSDLLAP